MTDPIVKELTRSQRDKLYNVLIVHKDEVEEEIQTCKNRGHFGLADHLQSKLDEIKEVLSYF